MAWTDSQKTLVRELVLLGVSLSREGDAERVLESLSDSQFENPINRRAYQGIKSKDGAKVAELLEMMGVVKLPKETAVQAIIRETQYITVSKMEAELTAARNLMNRTMQLEAKA